MPDRTAAVFLSYASQDAEAARRIAEALRAAGVEVWFDESELVGGDAWDQKIRRQITSCALFLPIISQNTQARTEGYFRLEWRLAEQRTFLMAKGRPFLVPIVIDDTRDAGAHVPDAFLEVQWSRLPAGNCDASFPALVQRMLNWDGGAARPAPSPGPVPSSAPIHRKRRPAITLGAVTAIVIGAAVAIWVATRPSGSTGSSPPATPTAPVLSEADRLVRQAQSLIDDDPLTVRANFVTAKQLGERAIQLDPGNAEAYAVAARAAVELTDYNQRSPEDIAAARAWAESAVRLSPDSIEAGLAIARLDNWTGNRPEEAERRLESLLNRAPDDRRIIHALQTSATTGDRREKWIDRGLALPGGDPVSLTRRARDQWALNQYSEMEATLDQSLAIQTTAGACHFKLMLLVWGRGDMEAGRAWVNRMPAALLQEDRIAYLAFVTWYWSREPDKALEVLRRFPRPIIEQGYLFISTDYLSGCAHLLAGRASAAESEFREGLKVIDDRLAKEPNSLQCLFEKTRLLVRLGRHDEAAKTLNLLKELAGPSRPVMATGAEVLELTGSPEEAVATAERSIAPSQSRWPIRVNELRFDPVFDPLRADPRFQAIVARGEAQLAQLRGGGGSASSEALSRPAASAAGSPDKSVAVLAFANLSDDKDNEYFSDGISDELLNVLGKVPGLKVTARTSSFHFKGKDTPIPEIAQKLGVAYVVEGSVRKAGNQVRITAQLIKAADGFHVWSDSFTRDLKDIFSVQDEIAGLIATNLSLKLQAGTVPAKVNPEAFRLYLEGRQEWSKRLDESLTKAEELFKQAVALDPEFARAYAGLADVWAVRADRKRRSGQDSSKDSSLANASLDRALQIDPDLAEAYATRGNIYSAAGKTADAAEAFQRALALNPSYASARQWYGRLLFDTGSFDAGLSELEIATRLDPLSPIIASNYAMYLGFARRWAESLAAADKSLAIRPNGDQAFWVRTRALIGLGRRDEALDELRARNGVPGGDQPEIVADPVWRAELLALAGDRQAAEKLAGPALAADGDAGASQIAFNLYLALDRPDDAFAYAQRVKLEFWREAYPYLDQVYDSVRDDPRFLRAIEGAGALDKYRDAWAQYLAWRKRTGQP